MTSGPSSASASSGASGSGPVRVDRLGQRGAGHVAVAIHRTNRFNSSSHFMSPPSRFARPRADSISTPRQPHITTVVGPYSLLVSRDRIRHQCRCGHHYAAHQHYRGGSECSLCSDCMRYRADRAGIVRMVASLTKVLKSRTDPQTSRITPRRGPSAPMPHPGEPDTGSTRSASNDVPLDGPTETLL